MTEKDYSGATTSKIGKNAKATHSSKQELSQIKKEEKLKLAKQTADESDINKNYENYIKAGKIASKVKEYAKTIIKKDEKLLDIAEKIENKILEFGGEIAFPVNLSIDDIAAHYTPTLKDETLATGLLNVDIGVHIKGCICDIAFSVDLTQEKKHPKLIEASENALARALELIKIKKEKTTLSEIGSVINKEITKNNFIPIVNLSGHSLGKFEIHSGLTIPNYDNSSPKELGEGAFAIEPFATLSSASGTIYEGAGSNIYHITNLDQQVRDNFSREILEYIFENKKTLPFSQRELEKRFGTKALIALSNLKRERIINEFPQLIEKSHQPVSQAETSIIIHDNQVEVLC
jgi:methionyl aminopeptidase